ncbi:glycosyltransferase 87 family protein [Gordonia sp. ABSL1-1]|uniref:glycosyltransferase 87 family protein n=1 Tax=Gordonia sp. ABSL1-1 TaxID=3053923 RepID=UPI00257301A0|nr:glycosyltransferase 87 family protein [Gordonia sp. ABSL1-1]MDL9936418.1 glycosyltransferase 87 family protein [Gordonia sp. ABSL1-1]
MGSTRDVARRDLPWGMALLAVAGALVTVFMNTVVNPIGGASGLFGAAIDVEVYQAGAAHLWSGESVYDGPVLVTSTMQMMFTYPPFAAVLFSPLAALPYLGVILAAYLGNVILLAALVGVCLRLLRFRTSSAFWCFTLAAAVALLTLEPVRSTFALGQINILLVLLVVADIGRRGGRLRGVGVGIAAGLKLTPLIFVVYLLLTRQWRTAATAVTTFVATVLVGFLVLPVDAWHYWTGTGLDAQRIGVVDATSNQSVKGYLSQLLRFFDATGYRDATTGIFVAPAWMWVPAAAAVAALGLWAAWAAHRRGVDLLAVAIVGMVGCAASPFAWGHHWVWVVPLVIVAVDYAWTVGPNRPWVWVVPAVIVAATFMWWFRPASGHGFDFGVFMLPRPADAGRLQSATIVVAAGCYPILLTATAIVTLWWARSRPAESRRRSAPIR